MKELGDMGTYIEGVVPYAPGLQGGSGNLKLFGCLTLGDALSVQLAIVFKLIGSLETVPALVTVESVVLRKIDDRAQRYLPLKPLPNPNDG